MQSIIMLPFLSIHLYLDGMWLLCGSKNTPPKKHVYEKILTISSIFIYSLRHKANKANAKYIEPQKQTHPHRGEAEPLMRETPPCNTTSNLNYHSKGDGPYFIVFIYLVLGHLCLNSVWFGVAP